MTSPTEVRLRTLWRGWDSFRNELTRDDGEDTAGMGDCEGVEGSGDRDEREGIEPLLRIALIFEPSYKMV